MEYVGSYAGLRRLCGGAALALSMVLVGCAGTVKHMGPAPTGAEQRLQGLSKVTLEIAPKAKAELHNQKPFNEEELTRRVRDRLQAKGLVGLEAGQYLDIEVTSVRVRSAFTAIMFGFMAGDDHIAGRVRLMNDGQQQLRAFDVSASYAFGGFAGGQDGTRMQWLYNKFADLVLQEVEKLVAPIATSGQGQTAPVVARPPTAPAVVKEPQGVAPPSASMAGVSGSPSPIATSSAAQASPLISSSSSGASNRGSAPLIVLPPSTPADKVLENSTIAHRYHIYLSRPKPKAFAVSESGGWWMAWGDSLNPTVKETIPQRALRGCQERSQTPCVLYAIDDKVVYGQGLEGKR